MTRYEIWKEERENRKKACKEFWELSYLEKCKMYDIYHGYLKTKKKALIDKAERVSIEMNEIRDWSLIRRRAALEKFGDVNEN